MHVKSGYKVSEVGVIPEEWGVKKLGELFEITSSKRVFQEDWRNSGVPFYRTRELVLLSKNGKVDNELFIDETMYHNYTSRYGGIQKDDLLVSGVGTLGIVYVVKENDKFYFKDGNIIWFKSNKTSVSNYIKYQFQSSTVIDQIKNNSTGTTVGTYTIINAKDTIIPFPPLPEQQKIAEILSTVDEHISETEELIEKTKTLKQGMMQRLLTKGIGHTEFKETEIGRIPASWEVLELEQAAKIIMGQSPNSGSYNTTGKGLPFYQGKADFGDKYPITRVWCSESIKIAPPDSILISVRAPVGSINLSQVKSCIGRGLAAIVVEDARTRAYLYFYLQFFASKFEKVSQGSTFTAINSGDLYGFLVATPCIAEQEKISSMLSGIDDQIDTYKCKLDTLARLKSGLMQQLLTGRIRVKV